MRHVTQSPSKFTLVVADVCCTCESKSVFLPFCRFIKITTILRIKLMPKTQEIKIQPDERFSNVPCVHLRHPHCVDQYLRQVSSHDLKNRKTTKNGNETGSDLS
eukprot:UN19457